MITPEKNHKIIFFFGKKMRPKSVVSQSRKILQLLKKIFSKKNCFQLICPDMIFKMVCGIFFLVNGSRDI